VLTKYRQQQHKREGNGGAERHCNTKTTHVRDSGR
jgi:hypothetical protein